MSKITKSARNENCQIRIPGICNFDHSTTVFCHVGGGGMALKSHDILGAYGCSACHNAIDGRMRTDYTTDELKLMHLEGVARTQIILIEKELISVK